MLLPDTLTTHLTSDALSPQSSRTHRNLAEMWTNKHRKEMIKDVEREGKSRKQGGRKGMKEGESTNMTQRRERRSIRNREKERKSKGIKN